MKSSYFYILKCSDNKFYCGSTKDLVKRYQEHQEGLGANFTKKRLPVELVYYEEFPSITEAFFREKQVQGWSRKKKQALLDRNFDSLKELSESTLDRKLREESD